MNSKNITQTNKKYQVRVRIEELKSDIKYNVKIVKMSVVPISNSNAKSSVSKQNKTQVAPNRVIRPPPKNTSIQSKTTDFSLFEFIPKLSKLTGPSFNYEKVCPSKQKQIDDFYIAQMMGIENVDTSSEGFVDKFINRSMSA